MGYLAIIAEYQNDNVLSSCHTEEETGSQMKLLRVTS